MERACGSCDELVDWVLMKSGRFMPVELTRAVIIPKDAAIRPMSRVLAKLVTDDGGIVEGYIVDGEGALDVMATTGRLSHFARCTNAAAHRKRGAR